MILLKKINLGVIAHVDAGKTTVTEQLLYHSGVIKEVGRVDLGNTQTDSMELERKRGITIKAATTSFDWNNVKINLIDTPGHVDFIAEVERSLSVLDGLILVISAREGIQSQTRVLFETAKKLGLPMIIFINKVDRMGANCEKIIRDLKSSLSRNVVPLQRVLKEGNSDVVLGNLYDDSVMNDEVLEVLCDIDDRVMNLYANDCQMSKEYIVHKVQKYSEEGKVYPILCGSALMGLGIEALLDGITEYLPCAKEDDEKPLSAVVFKIDGRDSKGKKVYIRILQGRLNVRDKVKVWDSDKRGKVKYIFHIRNGQLIYGTTISTGDMCVIYGIDSLKIGDIIGTTCDSIKKLEVTRPILKTKISPVNKDEQVSLFKALAMMADEDPLLDLEVDKYRKQIYINLFGYVQMEVISSVLEDLYNIKVEFSNTTTIYKETPRGEGQSYIRMYSKFNPYAATIGLKVEPLPRGQGIKYVSEVSLGDLAKSFQTAVEEGVLTTLKEGLLGWELTDIKVTFIDSDYDSVNSTPSDFRTVAPMVLMEALDKAQTQVLEPIYEFELKVPKSVSSRAISDLQKMRAMVNESLIVEENFIVRGIVPVENSNHYSLKVSGYTEGLGSFFTKFYGYEKCEGPVKINEQRSMINPLNKKEYLLYKMNAIRND